MAARRSTATPTDQRGAPRQRVERGHGPVVLLDQGLLGRVRLLPGVADHLLVQGLSLLATVAMALRQTAYVTALRQYLRVLAGQAHIEGVDIEAAETPLVQ